MIFDTYLNMLKLAMEYQQIVAKIMYITGKSEEDVLKKIAELNTGESNIDTANYLYRLSLVGKW